MKLTNGARGSVEHWFCYVGYTESVETKSSLYCRALSFWKETPYTSCHFLSTSTTNALSTLMKKLGMYIMLSNIVNESERRFYA
jgi:hypothetical protein